MAVKTKAIEKIQTGLTANYVPYWSVVQGLKEAMQNIAYGSIKSDKPAKLYYDTKLGLWAIKDKYTGFEKKHLYIGESEQRDDADGLGTFGEGWKIFLLVMARNNIHHQVDTVGFSFWGSMEETPHGTDVLVINVQDNDQSSGTRVYADVEESLWRKATESFAVLQGIEPGMTKENLIFKERSGELWVQGVRIEQDDDTNPLSLYYSYNLTHRHLINRDRSHVNTESAYSKIKQIVFEMDEEDIKHFVTMALEGKQHEDILRGPCVPYSGDGEQKLIWLEILADLHACKKEKLVIPSYNQAVNSEAKKRGFHLLDTPRKWDFEIQYLGIRKADDVIDDRFDVKETRVSGGSYEAPKTHFAKAKNKFKTMFNLTSVKEFPTFQYVEEIKNPVNEEEKFAHYEKEINTLYIHTSIMNSEKLIIKHMLPEMMEWFYKNKQTMTDDEKYQEIIFNLLKL
jgi:hypothetical protein